MKVWAYNNLVREYKSRIATNKVIEGFMERSENRTGFYYLDAKKKHALNASVAADLLVTIREAKKAGLVNA